MPSGTGLFSLIVRLFSGSLLRDLGDYAKREARLAAIATAGLLAALTFALGTVALCFVVAHATLAPQIGTLPSLAVLTGVCVALAVVSMLVGVIAARSLAVRPTIHPPSAKALTRTAPMRLQSRLSYREADEVTALLIGLIIEDALLRRARRR